MVFLKRTKKFLPTSNQAEIFKMFPLCNFGILPACHPVSEWAIFIQGLFVQLCFQPSIVSEKNYVSINFKKSNFPGNILVLRQCTRRWLSIS